MTHRFKFQSDDEKKDNQMDEIELVCSDEQLDLLDEIIIKIPAHQVSDLTEHK